MILTNVSGLHLKLWKIADCTRIRQQSWNIIATCIKLTCVTLILYSVYWVLIAQWLEHWLGVPGGPGFELHLGLIVGTIVKGVADSCTYYFSATWIKIRLQLDEDLMHMHTLIHVFIYCCMPYSWSSSTYMYRMDLFDLVIYN